MRKLVINCNQEALPLSHRGEYFGLYQPSLFADHVIGILELIVTVKIVLKGTPVHNSWRSHGTGGMKVHAE
jgi:hypothetical protein